MNAMRNAFAIAALLTTRAPSDPICVAVDTALSRKPRLSRDEQRGWSTKVSFRTYHALQRQGILD